MKPVGQHSCMATPLARSLILKASIYRARQIPGARTDVKNYAVLLAVRSDQLRNQGKHMVGKPYWIPLAAERGHSLVKSTLNLCATHLVRSGICVRPGALYCSIESYVKSLGRARDGEGARVLDSRAHVRHSALKPNRATRVGVYLPWVRSVSRTLPTLRPM